MAPSTITRDTWTNDSGSFSAPAGDGTVLANTVLQNHIYARIDAMFAGAGAYNPFTLGGKLAVEGFGAHTFVAGGSGEQKITIGNTTAGTGNKASLLLENDGLGSLGGLSAYSSTYSPLNVYDRANAIALAAGGQGGLSIAAYDSTVGHIYFYTGGSGVTLKGKMFASGGFWWGTSPSDPGADAMGITQGLTVNGTISAVGGKIQFPATQVPSAGANVLDDYEEGVWTPVIGGSTGTSGQAYTLHEATYVKIGSMVWASCNVLLSTKGSISGNLQIQGLPFTAQNGVQQVYAGTVSSWVATVTSFVSVQAQVKQNSTVADLLGITAAATSLTNLVTADIGNATGFVIALVYQAAN